MFQDRRTKLLRPFDRTRFGFILTEEERRNAAAEHEGVADSTKETFNKIFHIFICIRGANGDTGEGNERKKDGGLTSRHMKSTCHMIKASAINTKVTSELFFKTFFLPL